MAGFAPASDNAIGRSIAITGAKKSIGAGSGPGHRPVSSGGYSARASSAHINAWSGPSTGRRGTRCLNEVWGVDAAQAARRWLFVGDAPNDASMFDVFRRSVGVANIVPALARLPVAPGWLTRASHGAGFEELAQHLLAAAGR
jgi:hypothetical protein